MKKNWKLLTYILAASLGILVFLFICLLITNTVKKRKTTEPQSSSFQFPSSTGSSPLTEAQINELSTSEDSEPVSPEDNSPDYSDHTTQQSVTSGIIHQDDTVNDYSDPNDERDSSGIMEVHFIDVGQGDATLIICDGEAMLVDAGDETQGTNIQYYLKKQGVSSLKYLFLTHPDSDHIGGADVIITKFNIDTVFVSAFKKPEAEHRPTADLNDALRYRRLDPVTPVLGSCYSLGQAVITIVGPALSEADTPNDNSIALMVQYGDTRFLFTGDAEAFEETHMLDTGFDLHADVYQVGHHGSSSSMTDAFLQAVNPTYAVISCGKDNSYGHPHSETLRKLQDRGVEIYRTDESGSIVAATDGHTIIWNATPSNTAPEESTMGRYYVNRNNKYFHLPTCKYAYPDTNPGTHFWTIP